MHSMETYLRSWEDGISDGAVPPAQSATVRQAHM